MSTKYNKLRIAVFALALAALTSLLVGGLSVAAPNRPVDVDETPFTVEGVCDFTVQLALSGKAKAIEIPGDRIIFTSPGLHVTVTNLDDPSKQVTLNITGAFHQTTEQDGRVVTVVTGRNLLSDPEAGFILAIGRFSFAFDAGGNLIQPLAGKGQLIDVCALID